MRHHFLIKVFVAIILGVLAGIFFPGEGFVAFYNLVGQLFLRSLTLMVIPLIAASIINGTLRLGGEGGLGKLGASILGSFFVAMAVAVATGMIVVLLFQPGSAAAVVTSGIEFTATDVSFWKKIEDILFRFVPTNIFSAAANGEIIGVIIFSALFGTFSAHVGPELRSFWEGTFRTLLLMTQWVMKFLPFGVFGLIAKTAATTGISALTSLGTFVIAAGVGLIIYGLILLPIGLWLVAGVNPLRLVKVMSPALFTAFSTSSSVATLPVALECVEKGAGVSNKITSLVLPLGISVNLAGSALYAAAVVTFIAQLSHAPMDYASLAFMYAVILMTSFGMAGIPSASLVAVVLILQTLHLPNEQLALLFTIERFVDMARTTVNVFTNSCCAVAVARLHGERTALARAA